ncbi:MAG TPA: ChbG/HpnK family deacetylase [Bacteroidota bacterium]
MKTLVLVALSALFCSFASAQQLPLIIRCDDIGMCHTVNMAFERVVATGIPVSASVMFACPWYQEAVDILKNHREVSVGIHLTLNAEWKNYRWGPVAGAQSVPSLVDSCGYFFPSRAALFANNPSIAEIEKELRAQITRAKNSGLAIDYLDYHMSAAVQTPELKSLVERLAAEYKLGISRWFGEVDVRGVYAVDPAQKQDSLLAQLRDLRLTSPNLLVFHIGMQTDEMNALVDLNSFGLPNVSKHREAELGILTSEAFRTLVRSRQFELLTYKQLITRRGLSSMKRPTESIN